MSSPEPARADSLSNRAAPDRQSAQPRSVGRYEITEQLGKGSMGAVYRARDTLLHREVAIKLIGVNIYPSSEIVESPNYPYRNFFLSLEYHFLHESTGPQLKNDRFVAKVTGRF